MDYIQVEFEIKPQTPWTEIITQELASINFESFTEENDKLQAYIQKAHFDELRVKKLIQSYYDKLDEIYYKIKTIPTQNWNAKWESDYQPVKINEKLLIHAPFHTNNNSCELSLEIQPQMSFGTGHHQTTYLLCEVVLNLDIKGKKVLDVGTGTGVLGILASKRGAFSIIGTDIDTNAVENARENCERNTIKNFTILEGDLEVVPNEKFDVIFANINKNVLLRHLEGYFLRLQNEGTLLLSGFFTTDVDDLIAESTKYGWKNTHYYSKDDWAVLEIKK